MIRNYLIIAFRNLSRNRIFTAINVLGLGLGIAVALLIMEYISFETSVNQFHTQLPNLYRLIYQNPEGGTWQTVAPGFGPRMKATMPEVQNYCRLATEISQGVVSTTNANPKTFREKTGAYADGSFFEMFSFPLQQGNPQDLKKSNQVFLSVSMAKKYFDSANATGKTLQVNNQFGQQIFTVAGVYPDFPPNSDLDFGMVFSLETLANPANLNDNSWASLDGYNSMYIETYLLGNHGLNVASLETKINAMLKQLRPTASEKLRLQPFRYAHLGSSLGDTYVTSGSLSFVYLLAAITLLILVVAWFNYVNLSTAIATKRSKEVGIRKVVGATRGQLMGQFLGESLLLNILGFVVALLLIEVFQKPFNALIDKDLSLSVFFQNNLWLYGLGLLLVGTVASGAYTALGLSSFTAIKVLKGNFAHTPKGNLLRKTLVVFQFSFSVAMIVATLVVLRQLSFMQNKELGLSLSQKVVIRGPEVGKDSTYKSRKMAFKNAVGQQAFVKDYSGSGSVPGNWYNYSDYGITSLNPRPGDERQMYGIVGIDERFCRAYQIRMAAGKGYSEQDCSRPFAQNDRIVINEKAAQTLGFGSAQKAIGQKINWQDKVYEIKGVIANYHHMGLRQPIDPVIYYPEKNIYYLTVSIDTDHIQEKMATLESLYAKVFPGNPFEYFFVDENFNKQYKTELQFGRIFSTASFLAIFIACLGLFGLATFMAEARTKEIGIRKVLGANVLQIMGLLSRDFLKLVVVGIAIACPVAYWGMSKWLNDFAYKTALHWWLFGLAGALAVGIALVTISSQALKAALMNPVKSLKTE